MKKRRICKRCVLDESVPDIQFNKQGVCNYCELQDNLSEAFPNDERGKVELEKMIEKIKKDGKNKKYDCIIGISGGVDSVYLTHFAMSHGLRPLAVHVDNGWDTEISSNNIKNIIKKLSIDLYTYTIDKDEMMDVLKAFMKASYIWTDGPSDIALLSALYKVAKMKGIKNILVGNNFRTEGRQPMEWTHIDARIIKNIHKNFGSIKKLKSFPNLTLFDLFKYEFLYKTKILKPLYFIDYDKQKAKQVVMEHYGWKDYGGHHHESVFTRFIIGYWLPTKFGADKRKITFSAQIRSGLRKREEALKELENPPYDIKQVNLDKEAILKTFRLSEKEFQDIMDSKNKTYKDFPSYAKFFNYIDKYLKFIYKIFGTKPMMAFDLPNYEKEKSEIDYGIDKLGNFKEKNILYLVHSYNNFQKDPIEGIAKHFKKVYVLVRYKPISKIVKYIPIKWLKKFEDSNVIDMSNIPKNVEVIRVPVWYWPYGIFHKLLGFSHYLAVDRIIKRYNIKFDIIHSHFIWSAGYVGMKLSTKYHKPFILTGHGFDVYELPFSSNFWNKMTKRILNCADAVLTVSRYNKKFLKRLNIDEKKIYLVNNGFKKEMFYIEDKTLMRRKFGIDENRKICVSVGNLEKVKGQLNLIKAIKSLVRENKKISCYIIGNGSQYSYLERLIKKWNLEENVFLLGEKKHSEIRDWISLSDVFVIPSLKESASVALLESLACGRPVVGTNVGIVSEVLSSEDYGFVVKVNDVKDLGKKISLALKKEWNPEKIERSVKNFTLENTVQDTIDIYSKFI